MTDAEYPPTITQPNGVVLDFKAAKSITQYARIKKFHWWAAKASGGPENLNEYVIFDDVGNPVWSGTSLEDAGFFIDKCALHRDFPR